MVGKLTGLIDSTDEDSAIIDVNGVGYHVHVSTRTLANLAPRAAVSLIIETHVREDHIHLYGFTDAVERDWFRLLTSVQRVGNKMALLILGAYAPSQLAAIIAAKDDKMLSRVSGVGPKLAERIVIDLKDKAAKLATGALVMELPKGKKASSPVTRHSSLAEEATSALINLGYGRTEAYSAAAKAQNELGENAALDAIIKKCLKELAA